jgi:hypothetical protein|tara:strand:- start:183 stop:431 length:249 start_codon:yes stop_codon:yes gene_type:complete
MLERFTFWGGIKRIAMLITVVLLALMALMYWGINVPDGDWFVGGEYEQKLLYGYINFISRFLIIMWAVLFILKWILSGFIKE